jgi:hypothetical protein
MVLDATEFSHQWVQAWNAHDVGAVLAHFHDDVLFTSPVAAEMFPETAGMGRRYRRHHLPQPERRPGQLPCAHHG